ncbi:MAG: DUF1223 domain-containing protein [Planctomycetota bacterium]
MQIRVMLGSLAASLVVVYTAVTVAQSNQSEPGPEPEATDGFAVVELFTSQGCSSCPPADRVLHELRESAGVQGQRIYTLSYHVDYWDGLGWRDPYASQQATERQRSYARAFRSNRIYTPQMVVNGETEFVGSRKALAKQAVQDAIALDPLRQLRITRQERDDRTIRVTVEVDRQPFAGTTLLVALVEPRRINDVARGENRGRKLSHASVVRDFVQQPIEGQSHRVSLRVPGDVGPHQELELVAFLQDGPAGVIHGATAQPVP